MRKIQKEQIIEYIKTLKEACDELIKIEKQNADDVFNDICANMQDFIESILGFIEEVAGENTKTGELLVSLYELLFRVVNRTASLKDLQKLIQELNQKSLKELNSDTIEIAFFCYKASMSDSLASIYFAAKNDPSCTAYFVPIPYFSKKNNGLGQMYFEGKESYSNDFELTDWQKYDFETRHPDVIFIMTPYDDTNMMTSVHPRFYAKNLRNHCDILCYVPYFVNFEDVDFTANGQEGFCANNGVLYSDYVYLQSENVKQAYAKAIKKIENQANAQGYFGDLNKKLIALGHPKFDAIANNERMKYPLPKDWEDKIGNRKIILYNTTVAGILNGNEQHLEKLKSVLEVFQKRQDVILWWRPHPLSEQTYESMRSGMLNEYRSIVSQYKETGIGIYDDSPDLQRSIVWSDSYYGDASSVVNLYQTTKKPILFQNIDYVMPVEDFRFIVDSYAIVGEDLFFSPLITSNLLLKMSLDNYEVEIFDYLASFEDTPLWQQSRFPDMATLNKKLYFAPKFDNVLAIYDIDRKMLSEISIPAASSQKRKIRYNSEQKFARCHAQDGYVFYFPYTYPAILALNVETQEVIVIDSWIKDFEKYYVADETPQYYFTTTDYIVDNELLYINCFSADGILCLNMKTMECEIIHISSSEQKNEQLTGYSSTGIHEKEFYLMNKSCDAIVRFIPKERSKEVYKIPEYLISKGNYQFIAGAYSDGRCINFLTSLGNTPLKIDILTKEITCIDDFSDSDEGHNNIKLWQPHFFRPIKAKDLLMLQLGFTNEVMIVKNAEYLAENKMTIKIRNEDRIGIEGYIYNIFTSMSLGHNSLIHENPIINLLQMINYLSQSPVDNGTLVVKSSEKSSGSKIYNHIKNVIL